MGYDLYVIKPEHWHTYNYNVLSVLHTLDDDEWYTNSQHEMSHRIWREWRKGYVECENGERVYFPEDLQHFYSTLYDSRSALKVADELETFVDENNKDSETIQDIREFVEWLRVWADKGAYFYLSH